MATELLFGTSAAATNAGATLLPRPPRAQALDPSSPSSASSLGARLLPRSCYHDGPSLSSSPTAAEDELQRAAEEACRCCLVQDLLRSSSTTTVRCSEDLQLQASYDHGPVKPAISGGLTPLHHQKHHDGNCNINFYGSAMLRCVCSHDPSTDELFEFKVSWFALSKRIIPTLSPSTARRSPTSSTTAPSSAPAPPLPLSALAAPPGPTYASLWRRLGPLGCCGAVACPTSSDAAARVARDNLEQLVCAYQIPTEERIPFSFLLDGQQHNHNNRSISGREVEPEVEVDILHVGRPRFDNKLDTLTMLSKIRSPPQLLDRFGARGVRAIQRGGARRNSDAAAWWMCSVGSGYSPVGRRSGATPAPTEYCLGYNLPRYIARLCLQQAGFELCFCSSCRAEESPGFM